MKICTKCGEEKPLEEFHNSKRKCGKKPWCKLCTKKINRARYVKNKTHINAKNKAYNETHPETGRKKTKKYSSSKKGRKTINHRKQRGRDALNDMYMRRILRQKEFPSNQITPELIGAQRNVIKIKRAAKEIQK